MLEAELVRAMIFPVMAVGAILIWRRGRQVAGRLLVLIGCLHMIGGWVGRAPIQEIIAGGFFNQADSGLAHIPAKTDRELVFWFLLWGPFVVMLGQLLVLMEAKGQRVPAWFGWELFVISVSAALLMPKAGFWWVLVPALLIVRRAHADEHAAGTGA
jgi:hypothetical protein